MFYKKTLLGRKGPGLQAFLREIYKIPAGTSIGIIKYGNNECPALLAGNSGGTVLKLNRRTPKVHSTLGFFKLKKSRKFSGLKSKL